MPALGALQTIWHLNFDIMQCVNVHVESTALMTCLFQLSNKNYVTITIFTYYKTWQAQKLVLFEPFNAFFVPFDICLFIYSIQKKS